MADKPGMRSQIKCIASPCRSLMAPLCRSRSLAHRIFFDDSTRHENIVTSGAFGDFFGTRGHGATGVVDGLKLDREHISPQLGTIDDWRSRRFARRQFGDLPRKRLIRIARMLNPRKKCPSFSSANALGQQFCDIAIRIAPKPRQ